MKCSEDSKRRRHSREVILVRWLKDVGGSGRVCKERVRCADRVGGGVRDVFKYQGTLCERREAY